MTVIIAQDSPDAIRGILKRWFIEPKPQVFIGSVNRGIRDKVLDYIKTHAAGIRLFIVYDAPNCQGFEIVTFNDPDYSGIVKEGFHLVATPQSTKIDCPF